MSGPALCPGHGLPLGFPPADRLPSTLSATDPRIGIVRRLIGTMRSSDSSPLPRRLRLLDVPSWPAAACAAAGAMRSPRFQRVPSARDVAFDPGRATGPRVTAPLMLPSTDTNASAPPTWFILWLNPTPLTIAVYARRGRRIPRRNTRYEAGATPYLDRTLTGWTTPALPGAPYPEPTPDRSLCASLD